MGLSGIDEDESFDFGNIDLFDVRDIQKIDHGLDEEISQIFFLGTWKDNQGVRVELLGGQHGGQGIKISIDVGGDNRCTFWVGHAICLIITLLNNCRYEYLKKIK